MTSPHVLLVEDNAALRKGMKLQLERLGCSVRATASGKDLDSLLENSTVDVVILDLILPGENALELAERLYDPAHRGIIILTIKGELDDKIRGLRCGADIYLVKPVDSRELFACIQSIYRRMMSLRDQTQPGSNWILDLNKRWLRSPDGRALELTPRDIAYFSLLASQPAKIISLKDISRSMNLDYLSFPEARLYTQLSRLRHKLSQFDNTLAIQTWRNSGYTYVGPTIQLAGNEP
jgi:two-component system OmpR family response regulator